MLHWSRPGFHSKMLELCDMKTKYVLHGGYAHRQNADNDAFHQEILKDISESPKILLVYFAVEKELYDANFKKDTEYFEKFAGDKKLIFEIAKQEIIVQQIGRSEVVYLAGGTTVNLLEALRKVENWKELVEGKIVAGESAGAYALSTFL